MNGYNAGGHSRSNSFSNPRISRDFPQFKDILPNALYKSMGYPQTPTYGMNGEKSGEPQYNSSVKQNTRKNENLIYRDDYFLSKYQNDRLRLKEQNGSLLNLSISGTRI